jgi:hypothetical protein
MSNKPAKPSAASSDPPLFQRAIGKAAWEAMPQSYRAAHSFDPSHLLEGRARVTRGDGMLARLIARAFGFPPAQVDTPVTVTMTRQGSGEHWLRNFDGRPFSSLLTPSRPGHVYERFGIFCFELELPTGDGRMEMIVRKGWILGLPMPRTLLPVSDTAEFDENGRFTFSVRLTAPLAGFIVEYRGWLVPDSKG